MLKRAVPNLGIFSHYFQCFLSVETQIKCVHGCGSVEFDAKQCWNADWNTAVALDAQYYLEGHAIIEIMVHASYC